MCQLDIFTTSIHREIRHQQLGPLLDQNTRWQELPWGKALIRWNQLTLEMPEKYSTSPGHPKARDMLQKVFENIGTTTGARGKRLAARRKEIVRDRAPWSEQPLEEVTDHLCNLKSERFRVTPLRKEHLLYRPSQADNTQQPSTPLIAYCSGRSSLIIPVA